MTLAPPQSHLEHDRRPAGAGAVPRRGPEPWRIGAAATIVAVVVGAVWLWGRPSGVPPVTLAAVSAEPWLAGQEAGAFEVVGVPADLAMPLADPDSIAGSIATVDVPAGVPVSSALLGIPDDAAGSLTSLRFAADTTAWPSPGPRAGSTAVVATALGGCALDIAVLADGGDGSIVVRVDAASAARYAAAVELGGLVVWPAPPDGWEMCRLPVPTRLGGASSASVHPFAVSPMAAPGDSPER